MAMKQFVPQNVCLSCDGCCRFKEQDSTWRPQMTKEEIDQGAKSKLADLILSKDSIEHNGYIKTVSCQGQHLCSFFNPEHNTCRIYSHRPFECQLYPFVLTKHNGQATVCVHLSCPHIQQTRSTPEFKEYAAYLKKYFKQASVRDFLKRNPSLIGDYSAYSNELEYLFTLSLSLDDLMSSKSN